MVTMALSEIQRDNGRKSRFFSYARCIFDAPVRGPVGIAIPFGVKNYNGVATRR